MRVNQPKFESIGALKSEFLEKFDALALDVLASEAGPILAPQAFLTVILERTGMDFDEVLHDWPTFTGAAGSIVEIPIHNMGKIKRIYLVGVGSGSLTDYRRAGAALGRKTKENSFTTLVTSFAGLSKLDQQSSEIATAFISAISLSQYGFEIKSESKRSSANTFVFSASLKSQLERAVVLANAVWNARDLIHTPSNIKDPAWMADQAKKLVAATKSSSLGIKVHSGRALAQFGGLNAVGNSVPNPGPRMIEITYAPTGSRSWPHIVLVGKGITFDTGGISLKRPYDAMMAMKSDMAGAAAILSALTAVAPLSPKVRITALLMCAENMVSATAQRPSDVIKHYGGTTVEVLNTDAEGRLVLADGLAYADLELNPDVIVDVATLTGSASLGLGKQYAAMYSRDTKLTQTLSAIGNRTGDLVWHMPLIDDYAPSLESDIADLNHTADKGRFSAGSVTAALFLENFVGNRKWVHLDIAGPARSEDDAGEVIRGGTGFATRLLIEWLASF